VAAATEYVTDPDPVPLLPPTTVTHEAPALALHAHDAGVVTATLADPPSAVNAVAAGAIV
jgi:hypothetical protein